MNGTHKQIFIVITQTGTMLSLSLIHISSAIRFLHPEQPALARRPLSALRGSATHTRPQNAYSFCKAWESASQNVRRLLTDMLISGISSTVIA